MRLVPSLHRGLTLAAIVLVLDQITKNLLYYGPLSPDLAGGRPQVTLIPDLFYFTLTWNRGVSFGALSASDELGRWLLVAASLLITVWLTVWLRRVTDRFYIIAMGLVIGGAIGNVIDRIRFGAVFDFIDIRLPFWHWVFNVADCGITLGGIMLFLLSFTRRGESEKRL